MGGGGPGDKEGVQVGKEIGVFEGRRVLWECRNLNPSENSLVFANSVCDWEFLFFLGFVLFYLVFEEEGFWCLLGLGLGFGFEISSSSSSSCSLWKGPSKDRFYRGGKGGDSAIQPTLLRPQFWMSLLALLSNLPLFFLFYYVLAMGFVFFFFCRFDWFALCFSNPWILFVGTWDPILRISTELHRSFCRHWYQPRSTWLPPLIFLFLLYLVFSCQSFFQQI